MSELDQRRIILGVTGGIAAYKSVDLVRRLRERGAAVRVVMTAGARHFVTPQTFQAVSGEPVRDDLWDARAEAAMGHIELARWADLVLVAPATADFVARLAAGLADDLLGTLCLATEAPLWLAPSMNRVMWANAATQDNVRRLADRGVRLVGPASGDQACGETGPGRMTEPAEIVAAVIAGTDVRRDSLAGRRVLVTAGPTRERIDPVRYISNHSTGKMGYAMARAARAAGARVVLISGPVDLPTPDGVERIDVESAAQMQRAVHESVPGADIFIATAAVADHRPAATAAHKLKKDATGDTLALEQTPDILAGVAALPKPPFTVGFAAETRDLERYALAKLTDKKVDMIVANQVGELDGRRVGFYADDNAVSVFWKNGRRDFPRAGKLALARDLVDLIARRLAGEACGREDRRA